MRESFAERVRVHQNPAMVKLLREYDRLKTQVDTGSFKLEIENMTNEQKLELGRLLL